MLSISMRSLFAIGTSLVLLCFFSYPDEIIPPDPAAYYAEGWTIHDIKPYLWVIPMLLTEFFSVAGPRKNLVWFIGTLTVYLGAILAWPVLLAERPEWVHPTHESYQGSMLGIGLIRMSIYLALGTIIRLVLLRYLFPAHYNIEEEAVSGQVEATVLDAIQTRTVQEIAANPLLPKPKFLFGEEDFGRISRFQIFLRRYFRIRHIRTFIILLLIVLGATWFFCYPRLTEEEALQRDLKNMYEAKVLKNGQFCATTRAVHAAYRVMEYISRHESFAGYSLKKAEEWLQLDTVPEAYRRQLRDDSDITLPSVENAFESRTRFLTVTDGRRITVLYIRTNAEGDTINVSEVQDAGWNAVADETRRRYGMDWRGGYFR